MSTYYHGIVVTASGIGEITGFSEEGSVTQITAVGHIGETVAEAVLDPKKNYTFDALFTDGSTVEEGDLLTIGTYTARVLTVKLTEVGAGYKTFNVTANRFVTNTLPAPAGS